MSSALATVKREPSQTVEPHVLATVAVFPPDKPGGQPLTALVKMSGNGAARSALVRVPLSEEKGEVWYLGGYVSTGDGQKDRWDRRAKAAITAAGYNKLNQFGGVSFATPETIVGENGKASSNPYFHRENGEIVYVKVRRIGIGRNALGNLVAIDLTVTYNIRDYFAQDVFAKWSGKKSDTAVAGWGEIFDAQNVPDEVRRNGRRKLIHCPGGVVLAIDLSSKDAIALISEHIGRQKFAERNAWTICERNILKKFYAASQLRPNDLTVPVVAWQSVDRDIGQLAEIAARSRDGKITLEDRDEITGKPTTVAVERESAVAQSDDIEAALVGDADEEMQHPEPDGDPEPSSIGQTVQPPPAKDGGAAKHLEELRAKVRDLYAKLGQDVADELLTAANLNAGIGWIAEVNAAGPLDAAVRVLTIDVAALVADTKRIVAKVADSIANRDFIFCHLLGTKDTKSTAEVAPQRAILALKTARAIEALRDNVKATTHEEWAAAIQDIQEGWL